MNKKERKIIHNEFEALLDSMEKNKDQIEELANNILDDFQESKHGLLGNKKSKRRSKK
jgi:hypothetical protein